MAQGDLRHESKVVMAPEIQESKSRFAAQERAVVQGFGKLVAFSGFVVVLSGFFIFGFQVYFWLKEGYWLEIDLLWLLYWLQRNFNGNSSALLNFLLKWLRAPQDWLGLHKLFLGVLDFIPLSLLLIVFGGTICLIGIGIVLKRFLQKED